MDASWLFRLSIFPALAIGLSEQARLEAQSPSVESCSECTLRLRELVRLGSLADGASRDAFSQVAAVPGGFVVAPVLVDRALHLYQADGRYVRTFRAAGDGPRELNGQVLRVKVGEDEALTALTSGRRANILSPRLEPIGAVGLRLPLIADLVRLRDGTVVVSSLIREDGTTGRALHGVAPDGSIRASWDPVDMAASGTPAARRALAPASSGGVWALETTGSMLRRFSPEGVELQRVVLDRPWFQFWEGPEPDFTAEPPKPTVLGIREIDRNRLLVVTAVAAEDWSPKGLERAIDDLSSPRYFDTMVEVFDLSSGALVASGRYADRLYLADGKVPYVYTMEEQASGDFVAVILEIRIE